MFKLTRSRFVVALGLLCICMAAPLPAQDLDDELFQPDMLVAGPELEKQADTQVPETSTPQESCILFHRRGAANLRLGAYEKALQDLHQAWALSQPNWHTPNNWCGRWRILMDMKNALESSGDWFGVLDLADKVTASGEFGKNPVRAFQLLTMRLPSYFALGMLRKADATLKHAATLFPEIRNHKSWPHQEHNINASYLRFQSQLLERKGNHREAETLWRQVIEHSRSHVSAQESRFGKRSQAAIAARISLNNRLLQIAANLVAQGKLGEAEYHARQALSGIVASYAFNTEKTSRALAILARIRREGGDLAGAERLYRLSLDALSKASIKPYSTILAQRRSELGFILSTQERWDEALKLFEQREQGLQSNPQQSIRKRAGHIDWAMALQRTGHGEEAESMLRAMLQRSTRKFITNPSALAQIKGYLAVILAENGKSEQALVLFREALPGLTRPLYDEGGENEGFSRLYRLKIILEAYLDLLGSQYQSGNTGNRPEIANETFRIADIARLSSVQRAMSASLARAQLPNPRLAELARREQDTGHHMRSLQEALAEISVASSTSRLEQASSDLREEIARLEKEQQSLMAQILQDFPDYAELISPRPAEIRSLQQALLPDEATVAFFSSRKYLFVWTVTARSSALRVVELSDKQLSRYVSALRQGLEFKNSATARFDKGIAYRIYQTLLAPDSALWASARLLNIIPHGSLAQLPLSLLLTEPPSSDISAATSAPDAWLIRKIALAQQPSANAFLALRGGHATRTGKQLPFIGFGDPVFIPPDKAIRMPATSVRSLGPRQTSDTTLAMAARIGNDATPLSEETRDAPYSLSYAFQLLPQLPDTASELSDMAHVTGAQPGRDLFLRERANERNAKATPLSRYRIIAFATHGLMAGELPGLDQPALALSNPALSQDDDNDGFLTMHEVLALNLNADWVILSACNTASAAGETSEAVSGLGRAFFYAGARSLLVSNWAVESASARLLTTGIFSLQASHPELARAEALRRSMLTLMQATAADGTRYDHPAFWAPFTLIGDGLD